MAVKWLRVAALYHLWFACVMMARPVAAQYVPETVPRAGEQRLNRFQYVTTHNSYERDNGALDRVSITDQLDIYDEWLIELDLRWSSDINDFWIFHDCAENAGNNSLDSFITQIEASTHVANGLIFLYFDSGNIGPCVFYPSIVPKPSKWPDLLETKLIYHWETQIYSFADFRDIDNYKWPSAQELLRRGKHIVPIVNQITGSELLFGMDCCDSNKVFYLDTSDQTTAITAANLGDSYLARHYPSCGWTCDLCADGWQWAVDSNYTFPASNCSDHTNDRLHPPLPTYVCCPTGTIQGRGSFNDAFSGSTGVADAVAKVQRHQDIKGGFDG
jgi:hypothetical protein